MKRIVMTGGGTAGHVTPNIALIPRLKKMGYEIHYIGTKDGIERGLIEAQGISYHSISAGKLRRYLDLKNLTDTFRVVRGFNDAMSVLRKLKPDVVFSKGGFVSCPVVWAAKMRGIPAIIHESDMTPGLANKLSIPFARKICYTFPETKNYIPKEKGVLTGIPVRESLFSGKAELGKRLCGFNDKLPVMVIVGGSQGSQVLNNAIRGTLNELLRKFQICHMCGKGNVDQSLNNLSGYKQFEYINEELPHVFAMADLVVSRAGATTIYELLALKKPNLLIPLSKQASRGDQILNSESFEKQGFSKVLMEEELNSKSFMENVEELYSGRTSYIKAMENSAVGNGTEKILELIRSYTR